MIVHNPPHDCFWHPVTAVCLYEWPWQTHKHNIDWIHLLFKSDGKSVFVNSFNSSPWAAGSCKGPKTALENKGPAFYICRETRKTSHFRLSINAKSTLAGRVPYSCKEYLQLNESQVTYQWLLEWLLRLMVIKTRQKINTDRETGMDRKQRRALKTKMKSRCNGSVHNRWVHSSLAGILPVAKKNRNTQTNKQTNKSIYIHKCKLEKKNDVTTTECLSKERCASLRSWVRQDKKK